MDLESETKAEDDWSLAELVVLSTTEPADRLAAAIGLAPDRSWNRGDPRKTRGLTHKFSGVTYASGAPRTARPEEHLDVLLARLAPVATRIAALAERLVKQDGRPDPVRLWLTHFTSNASPGYDFSPEQIRQIGATGAWLGFGVEVYDTAVEEGEPATARDEADLAAVGAASSPRTELAG